MLSFESLFNISLCCIKWHVRHIVWSPGEPGAAGAAAGAGAGEGSSSSGAGGGWRGSTMLLAPGGRGSGPEAGHGGV